MKKVEKKKKFQQFFKHIKQTKIAKDVSTLINYKIYILVFLSC